MAGKCFIYPCCGKSKPSTQRILLGKDALCYACAEEYTTLCDRCGEMCIRDSYVLLYNCDLFDKAGIPYPKQQMTWEQVYALAQQLQQGLSADEYAMMALPMDIQWLAAGRNGDYSSAENIRQISEWMAVSYTHLDVYKRQELYRS